MLHAEDEGGDAGESQDGGDAAVDPGVHGGWECSMDGSALRWVMGEREGHECEVVSVHEVLGGIAAQGRC